MCPHRRGGTKGYATTLGGDEDEEESFADEQLRKAVRRSQATMKPAAGAAQAAYAAQVGDWEAKCGPVGNRYHRCGLYFLYPSVLGPPLTLNPKP